MTTYYFQDTDNNNNNNKSLASQLLKKAKKRISTTVLHRQQPPTSTTVTTSSVNSNNTAAAARTTIPEIRRADSTVLLAHAKAPMMKPQSAVIQETDQIQLAAERHDRWIQNGIRLHEKGQLEKATHEFRRAAAEDAPMGMFFYGLSLRHGWVNEWIYIASVKLSSQPVC